MCYRLFFGCSTVALCPLLATPAIAQQRGQVVVTDEAHTTNSPFQLTAEQDRQLNAWLDAWEQSSQNISTFECKFKRWQYNQQFGPPNQPFTDGDGELRYSRPDKGMFHVKQQKVWQPAAAGKPGRWGQPESGDHWICDGTSLFEIDPKLKQIREFKIPPEMQGRAIADGPLPFLFNTTAAELKARYWMRLVAPPARLPPAEAAKQVWLEAHPKRKQDAQNFEKAFLVLTRETMQPHALMLVQPSNNGGPPNTERYVFRDIKTNDPFRLIKDFFVAPRKPLGWEWIVQQPPPQRAPQNVTLPPNPVRQARRSDR